MTYSNSGEEQRASDLRDGLSNFSTHDRQTETALASRAWGTLLIVVVNAVIFAAMAVKCATVSGFNPIQLALWGGNSATLDLSGQWWRLLTYQFLHANLLHIAINMWVMWNVGRLTERLYGSANLLFLYLSAGALAGLASIVWNPELVSVGASGSIFGVLGALLAFLLRFRNEAPSSVLRYWLPAFVFAGYNLFAGAYQPGIDNAAHVGGLIAGFILGAIVAKSPDDHRRFAFSRVAAAILIASACTLLPLWYLNAFHHRPSTLEAFAASHRWYVDGESKNIQLWQSLAQQLGSGSLSIDQARNEFEQNIVPFWKQAAIRLEGELKQPRHDTNPFLPVVATFATLRLRWAQANVAALRDGSAQNTQAVLTDAEQTGLAQAAIDRLKLRAEAENFPVPLNQSAVAVWIKSRLPGLHQDCANPPANVQRPLSPDDDAEDGPAQRHAIGCRAQRMFMAGDYRALDATMKKYARALSDLPDGSSRLEGLWEGLYDLFEYGGISVEEAMRRTSEWRKSVKGSVEPDLAEAMMFRIWAYSARGHGYASSVSAQAMQIYLARTAMAAVGLQDMERSAANDPMWYVLSLSVDRDQSVPIERQRALFDQGVARFPDYTPLYRQMLTSLMPRWGGSTQAVDEFIHAVSGKNGQLYPMTYAHLYLTYGSLEGGDYSVIESQDPDPDVLKQGLEEFRKHHPRSDYVLNSVAHLACAGHEYRLYRSVSPLLRGHISTPAWPDKLSVASCDKWSS